MSSRVTHCGPVLFSIAIQKVLTQVQEHHPDAILLAYLDDVFVCGPPEICSQALVHVK